MGTQAGGIFGLQYGGAAIALDLSLVAMGTMADVVSRIQVSGGRFLV